MARPLSVRRTRPNRGFTLLALALFVAAGMVAARMLTVRPPGAQIIGHARIIDGDSLVVGGAEVRLYGIDAPELHQRCTREGRQVLCGREAARALVALIAGRQVACERRDLDRYGRTVAVCRADGVDLGRAMAAAGHAVAYGAYYQEEAAARAARKGLWAGAFMRPRAWRDRERHRFVPDT